MTQIGKVMARKDAYSIVLALVVAQLVNMVVFVWPADLLSRVWNQSGVSTFSGPTGGSFNDVYVRPLLTMLVGLVLIEVVLQIIVLVRNYMSRGVRPVRKKVASRHD